ncbi:MAG: hypothetical protein ACOCP8_04600 [archaeon]
MNQIFAAVGVSDFKSYIQKYFLPIFLLDFIVLFLFVFGFSNVILKWVGFLIFFIVLIILFTYPILIIDSQAKNIEQDLHYFITYAGALSTVNLERKDMFEDLASKIRYKEIAKGFRKLLYLVNAIKLDFSTAAYKVASLYKTEHFSRFLERMGIALSFNANVSDFFMEEQKALMNSYAIIYKESLERIKLLEEMFVSLILAFSFVLSTILLMPFLTGINSTIFLLAGIFGILILDLVIIVFSKYFLPEDKLYHNLWFEQTRQNVVVTFFITLIICLIIFPFIYFTNLSLLLKAGIILTPLFFVGIYSNHQEKLVWQRDVLFPPFIRSLGDIHQSKGGTLTTTVETLMPHNFGVLNEMLERVYKRLIITKDKFNSWYYFSKESGSALIAEFMDIFVTVVYRGGSAQIAGEIVSDNMSRINGLRDIKKEYVSSLKGDVYGAFFGFALTIYISLLISSLLFNIFTSMTSGIDGMALQMVQGIFPTDLDNNLDLSMNYVAIIILIHSFLSAFLLKSVDGGNYFSLFQDFIILLWMGIVIEIILTLLFENMFASYFL